MQSLTFSNEHWNDDFPDDGSVCRTRGRNPLIWNYLILAVCSQECIPLQWNGPMETLWMDFSSPAPSSLPVNPTQLDLQIISKQEKKENLKAKYRSSYRLAYVFFRSLLDSHLCRVTHIGNMLGIRGQVPQFPFEKKLGLFLLQYVGFYYIYTFGRCPRVD